MQTWTCHFSVLSASAVKDFLMSVSTLCFSYSRASVSAASPGIPGSLYPHLAQGLGSSGGSRGLVERKNSLRKMVTNKRYSSREKKLQPVYLESSNIFHSFFAISLFCLSRGSSLPQGKVNSLVLRGIMCTCESLALPASRLGLASPSQGNFITECLRRRYLPSQVTGREKVIKDTNCKGNLRSDSVFYG